METNDDTQDPLVEEQSDAAAADAGSIGGEVGGDHDDPAMQPVEEGGGGVAEGFEQAEHDLVENATHGDGQGDPVADAIDNENAEGRGSTVEYAEPDEADAPDG